MVVKQLVCSTMHKSPLSFTQTCQVSIRKTPLAAQPDLAPQTQTPSISLGRLPSTLCKQVLAGPMFLNAMKVSTGRWGPELPTELLRSQVQILASVYIRTMTLEEIDMS